MSEHEALIAATEAALIRNPPNHTVDDPFGATGEAESDPYGCNEDARQNFVAGALFEHKRAAATKPRAVEEFVIVGEVSGKHISVSRSDAENIVARGNLEVLTRTATDWEPFTPTDVGSET